jgi:hypothetical protein
VKQRSTCRTAVGSRNDCRNNHSINCRNIAEASQYTAIGTLNPTLLPAKHQYGEHGDVLDSF